MSLCKAAKSNYMYSTSLQPYGRMKDPAKSKYMYSTSLQPYGRMKDPTIRSMVQTKAA